MKPSIKTIAERSGVSKTTVSFVLNGRGEEKNISAETQQRVLDTARQLNYKPNHLARSLSLGRSFTIGFIVPDISNPFFGKIARLVEHYAELKGYSVMVASTDESIQKEQKLIEAFNSRQIDGIILAPASNTAQKQASIPCVNFDRVYPDQNLGYITINNKETAAILTQKLIDKGHQKIALVSLSSFLPNIKERISGYKEALVKNQIPFDEEIIIEIDESNKKESVTKHLSQLLKKEKPPTAFLFLNNVLAAEGIWGVNKYFSHLVKKLDFGAFDNLDVFDYAQPTVISALQPSDDIAKLCVEMLIAQIEKNIVEKGISLATTIIDR